MFVWCVGFGLSFLFCFGMYVCFVYVVVFGFVRRVCLLCVFLGVVCFMLLRLVGLDCLFCLVTA